MTNYVVILEVTGCVTLTGRGNSKNAALTDARRQFHSLYQDDLAITGLSVCAVHSAGPKSLEYDIAFSYKARLKITEKGTSHDGAFDRAQEKVAGRFSNATLRHIKTLPIRP